MRSDVELLKVFAAFGIVWFHSGIAIGREFAYGGLLLFVIFSAFFAVKSTQENSFINRAQRLLSPWIFWSAVYAAILALRSNDIFPQEYSLVSKLLATPSIHLWYLPFSFFFLITIDCLKNKFDPIVLGILSVIGAVTLLVSALIWRQWEFIVPLGQYLHAMPAVFIGMLFGLSQRIPIKVNLIFHTLILMSILAAIFLNIEGVGVTYVVSYFAALVLFRDKSLLPTSDLIIAISKLTFGIYLIHPLVLLILRHINMSSVSLSVVGFIFSAIIVHTCFKMMSTSITNQIFGLRRRLPEFKKD